MQVGGGSAVVLAARKAGADLPNLSLPHLSPLPVTVPTHSLNFEQTQFSPKHYFFGYFYFIFPLLPTTIRPLTLFNVIVRLTYSLLTASLFPTPTFPSQRGTGEG